MIELLAASMLSCQESQELLNRVNEYARRSATPRVYSKVMTLSKKTTRSVDSNERPKHN